MVLGAHQRIGGQSSSLNSHFKHVQHLEPLRRWSERELLGRELRLQPLAESRGLNKQQITNKITTLRVWRVDEEPWRRYGPLPST